MRAWCVRLHRWFGLGGAIFLLITGLTGAVLPWYEELDALLNPELFNASTSGSPRSPLALAAQIEARHPDARVNYVPLVAESGRAMVFGVEGRRDAVTGVRPSLAFDSVFVDPVTGDELGTRRWGALEFSRAHVIPLLYELHHSLLIPGVWGTWLLGAVALLWSIDCFVGFCLTLPPKRRSSDTPSWWQRWAPAWKLRWKAGGFRLNFDLHRAGGLWAWLLLFAIAFTGFSLNLYGEIFAPALNSVSPLSLTPYQTRTPGPHYANSDPQADFAYVIDRAIEEGQKRGWQDPVGEMFYVRAYGFYRAKYFSAEHPHGSHPLGEAVLFFDGNDGSLVSEFVPMQGSAGDVFAQAQFPVHSGRILGVFGRILVSVTGLVVVLLAITGIVIWRKKAVANA